jgi:hypothetical protein
LMGTAIRVGFWLLLFAAFYFAFEEIGRNWTAVVAGAMRIPTWRVGLSVVLATIGFSLVPLSLKSSCPFSQRLRFSVFFVRERAASDHEGDAFCFGGGKFSFMASSSS